MSQDKTDYILLSAGFATGIVLPLILILCAMNYRAYSCNGLFKRQKVKQSISDNRLRLLSPQQL